MTACRATTTCITQPYKLLAELLQFLNLQKLNTLSFMSQSYSKFHYKCMRLIVKRANNVCKRLHISV